MAESRAGQLVLRKRGQKVSHVLTGFGASVAFFVFRGVILFDQVNYRIESKDLKMPGSIVAGPVPNRSLLMRLRHQGVTKIFPLITDADMPGLRTEPRLAEYWRLGFKVSHYPIPDMDVPQMDQAQRFVEELKADLEAGESVYIHCIAGWGRTGTLVSCFLSDHLGIDPEEAIRFVRGLCPPSVQTAGQYQFVQKFASRDRSG